MVGQPLARFADPVPLPATMGGPSGGVGVLVKHPEYLFGLAMFRHAAEILDLRQARRQVIGAVACPAVRIASLRLQPPLNERLEASFILVRLYMVNSASVAPGARGALWACGIGESAGAASQFSGSSQWKL